MSKKNPRKKSAEGNAPNQTNRKGFSLPKVSERRHPEPVSAGSRVASLAELAAVCAVWVLAARVLFVGGTLLTTALVAVLYFVGALSMYVVRAALEAKRRYGRTDKDALLYYNQMIKGDQKWSLYIGMSFFAVFVVMRWLFPSPNFDMVGIDIATAFYLGYIWTAKYKGEEHLPFQYMETVYLFLTVITNYIVYFLG